MARQAFEDMVLKARAKDRQTFGKALAAERGPAPGTHDRTEEQQDELWAHVDPAYADPQAFAALMVPKEQGGPGLTPLAASYTKYPNRQMLVEGAGESIDDQIAYADKRRKRMLEKGLDQQPVAPVAPPAMAPPVPQPQTMQPVPMMQPPAPTAPTAPPPQAPPQMLQGG